MRVVCVLVKMPMNPCTEDGLIRPHLPFINFLKNGRRFETFLYCIWFLCRAAHVIIRDPDRGAPVITLFHHQVVRFMESQFSPPPDLTNLSCKFEVLRLYTRKDCVIFPSSLPLAQINKCSLGFAGFADGTHCEHRCWYWLSHH